LGKRGMLIEKFKLSGWKFNFDSFPSFKKTGLDLFENVGLKTERAILPSKTIEKGE
jgi:hypothetical protein